MSQLLELKRELIAMQQQGRKFLSIEKLVRYCDLEDQHDLVGAQASEAQARYQNDLEVWREESVHSREGVRIINESAFHALKTLIIVSGGSAAALLAFIGSVWSKVSGEAKVFFAQGLGWFGGALIGAAFAYGLTYLCLLFFFELGWHKRGNCLRILIILLGVSCYAFLGIGLVRCFHGLHR